MDSYLSTPFCLGPFSNITREIICKAAEDVVSSYGVDQFGSLWESFAFGEDLIEEGGEGIEEEIIFQQGEEWILSVRNMIKDRLIYSAREVYLRDSEEAIQVIIEGKSWIMCQRALDGFPADISEDISFIRWSGLDQALAKICKTN